MSESELSIAPPAAEPPLTILYQDDYLVAVDKPSGMLVHRSFLDKHETRFVLQSLRDQLGCHVYPVHRLDRPTSGVLVFALSPEIARVLSQQIATGQWRKGYLAIPAMVMVSIMRFSASNLIVTAYCFVRLCCSCRIRSAA